MTTSQQIRVSNAEREPVVERLKAAYAEGRVDKAEFDQRVDRVFAARTRGELATVTADLPISYAAAADPGQRQAAQPRVTPHVTPQGYARPDGTERLLAALGHGAGIFTFFVGPLVMLFLVDRRLPFARAHIKAALNFQLILLAIVIVTFGLGAIVYTVAWIAAVIAGVMALAGKHFRYPCTPRLIR